MAAFDAEASPEYDPMAKRRPWSADEDEHCALAAAHAVDLATEPSESALARR